MGAVEDARYVGLTRSDLIEMLELAQQELHRERSGLAFRDRVVDQDIACSAFAEAEEGDFRAMSRRKRVER